MKTEKNKRDGKEILAGIVFIGADKSTESREILSSMFNDPTKRKQTKKEIKKQRNKEIKKQRNREKDSKGKNDLKKIRNVFSQWPTRQTNKTMADLG